VSANKALRSMLEKFQPSPGCLERFTLRGPAGSIIQLTLSGRKKVRASYLPGVFEMLGHAF
jgi:hypothetical protein